MAQPEFGGDRIRAERQRFGDVLSGAYAAVEVHLATAVDGGNDATAGPYP